MAIAATTLPSISEQVERLIGLGVHESAGIAASTLRAAGESDTADALLVIRPEHAPASA